MIQPFITQRSNSDDLGRFFVPYDAIVANVERALPALERFGARVKPYNVPNCLLWRFGPRYVEPQFYGIRPFREYEQDAPGAFRAFKVKQWFRVPQCRDCKEMCPGFRIEQLPQQQMLDGVLAAAEAFVASADAADAADAAHAADVAQHAVGADALTPGDGDAADPRDRASGPRDGALIFSGTELFAAETLRATWAALAERHGAVDWMTGLCERSDRRTLARLLPEAAARGWLARVVLVGAPMDQRFFAQRVLEKGTLEELRAGLNLLGEAREAGRSMPRLRMLLNVGDAMRLLDDDAVSGQWGPLVRALHRAAGPDVVPELLLAVPNFPRGKRPPDMDRQFDATAAMAKRLRVAAELAHLRPALLTFGARRGLDPARAAAMALAERAFATELEVEDWSARLFRQPLSMPELDFVSWTPPWIFERFDVETQVADFAAEAADEGSAALRQGAVAPAGAS